MLSPWDPDGLHTSTTYPTTYTPHGGTRARARVLTDSASSGTRGARQGGGRAPGSLHHYTHLGAKPPEPNEQIESITTTWHGAGKGVLAPGVFALCFIRHDLERAHIQSFCATALYTVQGRRVGHHFDTRRVACRQYGSARTSRSVPSGRSLRKCYGSSSGGCLRSRESALLRVIERRRTRLQRA